MGSSAVEDIDLDQRLVQLGYRPSLHRKLTLWQNVALAMSDVSPTMAIFLLAIGAISIGGTMTFTAMLVVSVAVFFIALCLAELGSMYPVAGGVYSVVRYSMPGGFTAVAMFNLLIQGIIIPASLVLGAGQFLQTLFPQIPLSASVLALILTIAATAMALSTIRFNAGATAFMVVVELTVLSLLTIGGLFHIHRSVGDLIFHPVVLSGSALAPAGFALLLAALAPTYNIINGYDSVLGFSEETKGTGRTIAYAVIISAVLAAVMMTIPLGVSMLSAPNLLDYLKASSPPVYSVAASLGPWAGTLANAGVTLALFNSGLACFIYYARIWFASGRDGMWPGPINRQLAKVNRYGAPWVALLVCVVPWAILLFLSSLNWLIIFTGSVLAAEYFCVGVAALWGRLGRIKDEPRPFRMPAWPLPPIIVIVLTGFALTQQGAQYEIGEAILSGAAVVFYLVMRATRRSDPAPLPAG